MMTISETPLVSKETVSAHAQLLYKGAMIVVAPLLLVIVFILASAPAAAAAPASTNSSGPSTFALHVLTCNGDTPGFCPMIPM